MKFADEPKMKLAYKAFNETFEPTLEICGRYDISLQRFMRYLQLNGGFEKTERLKRAYKLYTENDDITLTKVSELVGMNRITLSKHFKAMGETLRNPLRVHYYNEDYFEVIDTEEKAYWLGFIYADGCINVSPTYKSLEIGLASIDRGHLVKFVNAIGGTEAMIKDRSSTVKGKVYTSNRVVVHCTKLANDLAKYGVTPRKSLTLTFPDMLDDKLIPHFFRGYFDGDGTISYRQKYDNYRIALVGTLEFLTSFSDYYLAKVGATATKIQQKAGQNAYQYEKSGVGMHAILDDMYSNATVYLDRKYEKYLAVLAWKHRGL